MRNTTLHAAPTHTQRVRVCNQYDRAPCQPIGLHAPLGGTGGRLSEECVAEYIMLMMKWCVVDGEHDN